MPSTFQSLIPPAERVHPFRTLGKTVVLSCVAVAVFFIGLVWFETESRTREEEALALDGAVIASHNVAAIAAANLDEVLERALQYAKAGAALMTGQNDGRFGLSPQFMNDAAYLRTAVFDDRGQLVYSSSNREADPELAQVAAFVAQPVAPAALTIVRSTRRNGTAFQIPVAIPLFADRTRIGTFAAFIDLGYFLKRYKDVDLGSGGLEIRDETGTPIVDLHAATLSAGLPRRSAVSAVAGSGPVDARCTWQAAHCIGYVQKLERFPLAVAVLRDKPGVLARAHARHRRQQARASVMSALILLAAAGALVFVWRQRLLHAKLEHAQLQKQGLIEQLEEEKSRAVQLASEDYLTGIPNRMKFLELARAELARARRSRNLTALFFIDLDKFKPVNDTLGHAIGDLLLQAVANRLRDCLRQYDLVGRFGGDEFVVLVSELATEEQVVTVAEKLVDAVCTPFLDIKGNDIEISTSIGIALYPRDGSDIDSLLANADAAMYGAKNDGRGTYRFYDASLNASSARDFELLSRFRRALSENEFRLYYQARVRLQDNKLVGLEALLRWQHPEHGLIFPNEFIPLAEEHGLIVPLGEWVFDAACRQIACWKRLGLPLVPVAVNISARQLGAPGLSSHVMNTLAQHDVPPDLLELEVTESCFLEDAEQAKQTLDHLKEKGIGIALDDYGPGFSTLSHPKQLPVEAIKIDRSFIRDIRNDMNDMMIVSSTIILAHNLGLRVVAGGVESKEQLVHLKTAGCDEVQGFYFHRPQPAEAMAPILKAGHLPPK